MTTIAVQKIVKAPVSKVWESWDDYANIANFHPGVTSSFLLGAKQSTGMGALRQCDFTDGKTFLKERITGYEVGKKMAIEIYETNAPIKNASASFEFTSVGSHQTQVIMKMTFTPKLGLIGKMLLPLMKIQFKKGLTGLLNGNAQYVEGNLQDEK